MPRTYTTQAGDVLDLVVWREYGGRQAGIVEAVLEANRAIGLADMPPRLPPGLVVVLPDVAPATTKLQQLWD